LKKATELIHQSDLEIGDYQSKKFGHYVELLLLFLTFTNAVVAALYRNQVRVKHLSLMRKEVLMSSPKHFPMNK
jgi:hypothetical protein